MLRLLGRLLCLLGALLRRPSLLLGLGRLCSCRCGDALPSGSGRCACRCHTNRGCSGRLRLCGQRQWLRRQLSCRRRLGRRCQLRLGPWHLLGLPLGDWLAAQSEDWVVQSCRANCRHQVVRGCR